MKVFGEDGDTLLVDLKKSPRDKMATDMPVSLRDHLVFLELARFYSPISWTPKTLPCGRKPLPYCSPLYPELLVDFNAVVCHINSPSDFYIQVVNKMETLILMSKLQDFYSQGGHGLEINSPYLDQACVALFEDKVWYRAQIIGLPGSRTVEVRFVDFGNHMTLSVNNVRKIKDEFFALPAMAIQCSLVDVKPLRSADTWCEESIKKFSEMTGEKLVTAMATGVATRKNILLVKLFETSETSDKTNISEVLVKEKLARFRKGMRLETCELPATGKEVWDPPIEENGEIPEPDPTTMGFLAQGEQENLPINPDLELPDSLKDIRVKVTHVKSPGSFFVQLLQTDGQLKRIHLKLKEEFSKSDPVLMDWKENMHCAMLINGVWERGSIITTFPGNIAEVKRCDFGNHVLLPFNNLRPLHQDLMGSLALECCLGDIRPAGGSSTWTATACDFISFYLTGAMAIMTVKENTSVRPVPVVLYCSNNAGQDVSVADYLVGEGLALKERNLAKTKFETGVQLEDIPTVEDCSYGEESAPMPLYCPPAAAHRTFPKRERSQPYSPPDLPHCGRMQVLVTHVGDDGVIHAMTSHAEQIFETLKTDLQQHIKSLPRQRPYSWALGHGCAVMGSDMLWYRAEVLEVMGGNVKVRYVDQGLIENIPMCHIIPTVLYKEVPRLCIPCQLHGVIPVGTVWQTDAVALLKELLQCRSVDMQIMELPSEPLGKVTVQIHFDGMTLSRIMEHHRHASRDPSVSVPEEALMTSSNKELENWDLNIMGLTDERPLPGLFTYPPFPDTGEHFPVRIKHIRTPNEIVLCPAVESASVADSEGLDAALKRVNEEVHSLPLLTDFSSEAPCLAKYSDGKYYRAKLLKIENFNPVKVLVRHVDYGSDDSLTTDCLREIPVELLQYPCQGIEVKVAGIRPPEVDDEEQRLSYKPEWSLKSIIEMMDLLHGKQLTASVLSTEPEITAHLYDEDEMLVLLPLVDKGLADLM
ncbi:RNF17 protein, partial [Amia calva]|nr:RNF17 protein [Amia calva]